MKRSIIHLPAPRSCTNGKTLRKREANSLR